MLKNEQTRLWNYLKRKLKILNDNNFTARQIFDYVCLNESVAICGKCEKGIRKNEKHNC